MSKKSATNITIVDPRKSREQKSKPTYKRNIGNGSASKAQTNDQISDAPVIKEAWESNPPKPRRRSIIREFALNTSTHALPGIARSKSKHNRAFWAVSFVAFTGVMILFVTQSILRYFEYPTQTSVSIVIERSQAFPAVTICNYGPARFDLLVGPFLNFTNARNLTITNDTTTLTVQQIMHLYEFLIDNVNTGENVNKFFFTLDVMLISCTYNDLNCTAADFLPFTSSTFGSCYTFNAKTKNNSSVRHTNDNGARGKLQLRLYPHKHLYIPLILQDVSVGMVAMIHGNTELPLIEVAGTELAPGRKHKLNYRKRSSYSLPAPYTDCTSRVSPPMEAMFDNYVGADYAYSQGVCYILCTQAYVYTQCGCASGDQWLARSIILPGSNQLIIAQLCNITDSCPLSATNRLLSSSDLWDQFCSDCTQACSTTDFIITPSSVPAPALPFAYVAKAFVESVGVPLPANWSTNWQTEVEDNYIGLDVVCQSTLIENFTQNPSITAVDVLSNVGGQSGLWIGISFLSVMELIEMLYRLTRHEYNVLVKKIRRRMQMSKQ